MFKGEAEIDRRAAPPQEGRHDVCDGLLLSALEQVLKQQEAATGVAEGGAGLLEHLKRHVPVGGRLV
jgi:hypothetical protein